MCIKGSIKTHYTINKQCIFMWIGTQWPRRQEQDEYFKEGHLVHAKTIWLKSNSDVSQRRHDRLKTVSWPGSVCVTLSADTSNIMHSEIVHFPNVSPDTHALTSNTLFDSFPLEEYCSYNRPSNILFLWFCIFCATEFAKKKWGQKKSLIKDRTKNRTLNS